MTRILVLADDLTGAADCGLACAGCGLGVIVALDDCRDHVAEVLAIDANTRASQPHEAAAVMERLIRAQTRGDDLLIYKKIDSTLRGNVAAELKAVLAARKSLLGEAIRAVAVFAPAFPATGRTTVGARLLVNGTPLLETDLWHDERNPPPESLITMLGESGLRPAPIALSAIRGENLRETMTGLAREADVLVCDAQTEEDLRAIADASMALGPGTVWVGSAGLACHLPRSAGLQREASPHPAPLALRPALFVVGSASNISRQQARVLESRPDLTSLRLATGVLRAGENLPEWQAHRAALERAFSAGIDVLLTVGAEESVASGHEPQLVAGMAELLRPFADAVGALVITGGETARAVFDAWGIQAMQVVGEVEPGLPYSISVGWRRQLAVLTKAGGFGRPETLLHCRQFLRSLTRVDRG